ncbi:hypothetical protein LSAT2_005218 [Lamellibrachia satsuma]|nr:hypothetical protein LSAT2_005218 [Lamellibrachia satsuma]
MRSNASGCIQVLNTQGIPNITSVSSLPPIRTILPISPGLARSLRCIRAIPAIPRYRVTRTPTTPQSLPSTNRRFALCSSVTKTASVSDPIRRYHISGFVTIAAVASGFIASSAVVVRINLRPSPTSTRWY